MGDTGADGRDLGSSMRRPSPRLPGPGLEPARPKDAAPAGDPGRRPDHPAQVRGGGPGVHRLRGDHECRLGDAPKPEGKRRLSPRELRAGSEDYRCPYWRGR
jgi:hypothetical protein